MRAVGEELTVSADGKQLGIVRDTSHQEAGHVQVYAKANGYFRDIEYVPLHGAAAAATSTNPTPTSKDAPAATK